MFGSDRIGEWPGPRGCHERSHRSWLGKFKYSGLVTATLEHMTILAVFTLPNPEMLALMLVLLAIFYKNILCGAISSTLYP